MSIVNDFDIHALKELHEHRTVFRYKGRNSLLLVDYLLCLSWSPAATELCDNNRGLLESAYDLTLSKFFEIPQKKSRFFETVGIDCRYYFRAFMDYFQNNEKFAESVDTLDMELLSARAFQSFVTRHYYLSCLECIRREKKIYRRYQWRLDGQVVNLWMPTEMTGSMCRKWLQVNVDAPDPARPGERDRIQQIVYDRLGYRRLISLDCFPYEIPGKEHFGSSVSDEMPRQGLAEIVSQEKSESIDQLHYKIAELGPVRIKRMVLEIFDQLLGGKCRAKEIACKYGLDKVTFSRFAGMKWSNSDTVNLARVPVLWKNTAGILASDDRFVQAAKNSGLWDKIRAICGDRFPRREDK